MLRKLVGGPAIIGGGNATALIGGKLALSSEDSTGLAIIIIFGPLAE